MTKKEILSNLHKDDTNNNVYEYILEDGEELTLRQLKTLNGEGYVYHSQLEGVDFEDEEFGVPYMRTMNIYYFSKANINIHEHQIPA
jgi:hypothetical protein